MLLRPLFYLMLVVMGLSFTPMRSQSAVKGFAGLSGPEKWWVIWHPFKAGKAFEITNAALKATDSLEKEGSLGTDRNGGDLDAFKHGYWMACLSAEIGEKASLKLGAAHEKGNYRDFKKRKIEDGALPDEPASEMDLFNNARGVAIGLRHPGAGRQELAKRVKAEVRSGQMRVLYKKGKAFLDCQGRPLDDKEIRGRWQNDKCLVPSGG